MLNLQMANSQVPQGLNYQAIAYDDSYNPIKNATIKVKLSILSDTTGFYQNGGTYIWEEEHTGITTNNSGLFSLVLGNPSAVKIQGTAASFSDIDWSQQNLYIGTKIANPSTYKIMGASKLWSVPYAMITDKISGPVGKLEVKGETVSLEDPLFEVKNINGQTIFAVYNEGVRIYVDDGAKGPKGGFAIGGFGEEKAPSQEYFRVTRDSTRVYVNKNSKGAKGGFAIGGFDATKGVDNFLNLTPSNYFIGHLSGYSNTTGLDNIFLGNSSGKFNTLGCSNVFIGHLAGYSNVIGTRNIFIGDSAGYSNYGSDNPVSYPYRGSSNIFIGDNAGTTNTTGYYNVFIGTYAGHLNTTGSNCVFIGYQAGRSNTSGIRNIFIGKSSGKSNTSGSSNTFVGMLAGIYATGNNNVFMGDGSGFSTTSGGNNVFIGMNSGSSNTTGGNNVFIGMGSGSLNTTGENNTIIGYGANVASNNLTNATAIGYGASVNVSDKIVIGNSSATSVGGYGSWTNYSDSRLKENIIYKNDLGLDFIMRLKTVSFNYRDDKNKRRRDGLLAQDVQKVLKELNLDFSALVVDDDPEKTLNLSYPEFVIPLINAVQEQQKIIEKQSIELNDQKSEIQLLRDELEEIKAILAGSR